MMATTSARSGAMVAAVGCTTLLLVLMVASAPPVACEEDSLFSLLKHNGGGGGDTRTPDHEQYKGSRAPPRRRSPVAPAGGDDGDAAAADWYANEPQCYYGLVRLHQLTDGTTHSLQLRPKLKGEPSALRALEHRLPEQFQSHPLIRHRGDDEREVDYDGADEAEADALAEASQADRWAATLDRHGGGAGPDRRPPTVVFNIAGNFLHRVSVVSGHTHMPPFTLLLGHPDDMAPFENVTRTDHGIGSNTVDVSLARPFMLRPDDSDRDALFEVVVLMHPRRLSYFETTFTLPELGARSERERRSLLLAKPLNASMGAVFMLRWTAATGTLGVWVRRRPPIPDLVLEVWARDTRHANGTSPDAPAHDEAPHNLGRRLVGHGFDSVPPEGVGFSDVVQAADGLHEDPDAAAAIVFTARAIFAERPRPHLATFEIDDLRALVSRTRDRLDGELIVPATVDHHTSSARTKVLPVQLLIRCPPKRDHLSVEVLQPRALDDIQLWIRDGANGTLLLEEEAIVSDAPDHWRRDVRHFGYHNAIPTHRPVAGNRVRIDVLYRNASEDHASAAATVLRWASHNGASTSRVAAKIMPSPAANGAAAALDAAKFTPAAVLSGSALFVLGPAAAAKTNSNTADEGDTSRLLLMKIPSSLVLKSSDALRMEWIRGLVVGDEMEALAETDPRVAPFMSANAPTRDADFETLQLTLLLLSRNDPPPAHVRHQQLYRSLNDCHARARWAPPLLFVDETAEMLEASMPYFVQSLRSRHSFLEAVYGFLNSTANFVLNHPARAASAWAESARMRRGGGGNDGFGRNQQHGSLSTFSSLGLGSLPLAAFVDAWTTIESSAVLLRRADPGSAAAQRLPPGLLPVERMLVPGLCYLPHSDTPTADLVIDARGVDNGGVGGAVEVRARRTAGSKPGALITVDWTAPLNSGRTSRMHAVDAFSVLGTVPHSATDAADFPGGIVLTADTKSSRDRLISETIAGCAAWPAVSPPLRYRCLLSLRDVVSNRSASLPPTVTRPGRGSPLYGRGLQLLQRAPRLVQGVRRALRKHLDFIDDDVDALDARGIAPVAVAAVPPSTAGKYRSSGEDDDDDADF